MDDGSGSDDGGDDGDEEYVPERMSASASASSSSSAGGPHPKKRRRKSSVGGPTSLWPLDKLELLRQTFQSDWPTRVMLTSLYCPFATQCSLHARAWAVLCVLAVLFFFVYSFLRIPASSFFHLALRPYRPRPRSSVLLKLTDIRRRR